MMNQNMMSLFPKRYGVSLVYTEELVFHNQRCGSIEIRPRTRYLSISVYSLSQERKRTRNELEKRQPTKRRASSISEFLHGSEILRGTEIIYEDRSDLILGFSSVVRPHHEFIVAGVGITNEHI